MVETINPQPIISDSTTIPTYYIGSDMVILMGETALVSSKSDSGSWRAVDVVRSLCCCPGFQARGRCRHVDAVKLATEQDRASAETIEIETALASLTRNSDAEIASLATEILSELGEPEMEMVWAGSDYGWLKASDLPKSRCRA